MQRAVSLALCLVLLFAVHATGIRTALDEYVAAPDPNFKWEILNHTYSLPGANGYLLNLTSQQWLTSADSSRSIWWHYMVVIIPHKLTHPEGCLLWITGGSNDDGFPAADSEDVIVTLAVAVNTGAPTIALFQIPNQPIVFPSDPLHKRRSEDAIIAFTWKTFLDDASKAMWLLRLPMTKACVAAMNATEQYLAQHHGIHTTKWMAAGASKRGWTTWTLGAVEKRLIGMAPIVMDALNLNENVHHMWRNLGGWTFAFEDYYAENLTARFDDPNFPAMQQIIDGYSYLDRYVNLPKLVIDAGNDEFFEPDDNYYWWKGMTGEKHLLMVQNAEHSLVTAIPEVLMGMSAFVSALLDNTPRPQFTWDMDLDNGTITVQEVVGKAHRVKLRWTRDLSKDRRDFRWIILSPEADGACKAPLIPVPKNEGKCLQPIFWEEKDLSPIGPGVYQGSRPIPKPGEGWGAFFIEMYYKSPVVEDYRLTTQIAIIPNTFAFPPCSGAACKGTLV